MKSSRAALTRVVKAEGGARSSRSTSEGGSKGGSEGGGGQWRRGFNIPVCFCHTAIGTFHTKKPNNTIGKRALPTLNNCICECSWLQTDVWSTPCSWSDLTPSGNPARVCILKEPPPRQAQKREQLLK